MASKAARVGSSSRAAVGFRVHSGWAAFVAIFLDRNQPQFLARGRPQLVEPFTYRFRQPYHTARSMAIDDAHAFISGVQKQAADLAGSTIASLQNALHKQGTELKVLALICGAGKPLPKLENILASHALIHTADGELFRHSLVLAGKTCGMQALEFKEKELMSSACKALGMQAAMLTARVASLGKTIGPPWSQDEKLATLAAWVALAEDAKGEGR